MTKKHDYSNGKRYGNLVCTGESTLRLTPNNKYQYHICLCDCGNTVETKGHALINGSCSSCKVCYKKNRKRKIGVKVLPGERYACSVVIKEVDPAKTSMSSRWLCRCNCGKEHIIQGSKLIRSISNRCRVCAAKMNPRLQPKYTPLERLYRLTILKRQELNGILAELTLEEFSTLVEQPCSYCGDPPREIYYEKSRRTNIKKKIIANGIDRVNSNIGYIAQNCVPCCTTCNQAKRTMTLVEFYQHIEKIYRYSNLGKHEKEEHEK